MRRCRYAGCSSGAEANNFGTSCGRSCTTKAMSVRRRTLPSRTSCSSCGGAPRLDWNVFGLIAVIELERPYNPSVPEFLAAGYLRAIRELPAVVGSHPQSKWDEVLTRHIVCCIALARGQRVLARVYLEMGPNAAQEWLLDEIGYKPEE